MFKNSNFRHLMAASSNGLDSLEQTPAADIKSFFDSAPPLKASEGIERILQEFIQRNLSSSSKFVRS